MVKSTNIRISPDVRDSLAELKTTAEESYSSVIQRLLQEPFDVDADVCNDIPDNKADDNPIEESIDENTTSIHDEEEMHTQEEPEEEITSSSRALEFQKLVQERIRGRCPLFRA